MKCVNCTKEAEYFVRNDSSKEKFYCKAHIPSFLNFAKELQKRIFPVAVETTPVVEAPVEKKPAKKKKETAPVEPEAPVVVEEPIVVPEPEVIVEEPEVVAEETL
jgi:hypothetical protein